MGAAGTPTFSGRGGGGGPGSPGPPGPQGPPGFLNELDPPEEPLAVPGPPGAQGNPGSAGATGAAGPPGMDGADGEEGPMGPPGQVGVAGATGAAGAQGIQGAPGVDGEPGEDSFIPGPSGAQGATGTAGSPGAQGPQGPPGFLYDLDPPEEPWHVPGPTGANGASGATGATGPQGPPGPGLPNDGEPSGDELYILNPTTAVSTVLAAITSSSNNITGTATETAFSNGTYSLPGNTLAVGQVYRLQASGTYSSAASAPGTMLFNFRYGTVNTNPILGGAFSASPTLAISQTVAPWSFECAFTVRTIGSGTSADVRAYGWYAVFTSAASTQGPFMLGTNGSGGFDSTTTTTLSLFVKMSATTAGCILTSFVFERIR